MLNRTPKKALRKARRTRGFSIIELLVAIIIIGILVAVLIPAISNRTEQARQATVQADLTNLVDAMERVALDTGYYVRLFALNDLLRGDNIAFDRGQNNDVTDGLTDYQLAQPFYQFPNTGPEPNGLFIDPNTGDYAGLNRNTFIDKLVATESRYDGSTSWQGPYINFRRDNNAYDGLVAPDGVPDDPWGNNYIFFTRLGMVIEPTGEIADGVSVNTSQGGFQSGSTWDAEVFDRPTVLSVGGNGLPGDGITGSTDNEFGRGDDYFRSFGR